MAASSTENPMHPGVGISGIRERVRQLNGQLTIESSPQGTTVRATFPRPDSLPQQDTR